MLENRPVSELSPRMRQLFERARSAFQGGRRSYSVGLLRTILKQEPGCADVRKVLHAIHREMHAGDSRVARAVVAARSMLALRVRVPRLFRRERYEELLELLEDLLGQGAPARPVLTWLARVAETCHLPETGTVAVESLVSCLPDDQGAWRAYVDHCRAHDLHKRALLGLQRLSKLRPYDAEIQSELRQVAAADTMAEARWDQVTTYRDALRDEDEARQLEDERRPDASLAAEALEARVAEARQAVEISATSENRRRLGDLLRQVGDLDGALRQYESIGAAAQHVDPTLDEAIAACLRDRAEQDIRKWRDYSLANPAQSELAAARVSVLEDERDAALLRHYEERGKRFPLEARYQSELGRLHFAAGRFDEALRGYQAARRNPSFHLAAGIGAARCLAAKGLLDLAEREFMECLSLAPARSRERLAVLYELAALFEGCGRGEEAFAQLKEIYASDASYRDVGDRIDAYVRRQDAARGAGQSPERENAG